MEWNRPRTAAVVALALAALSGPGSGDSRDPARVRAAELPPPALERTQRAGSPSPFGAAASVEPVSRPARVRPAHGPLVAAVPFERSSRSPWWLDSGPPIEVRFGEHLARATPARLDVAALHGVAAGDRLTVALPDVGGLDVVVQRVTSPAPSIRQLQGHLADPVESYAVMLTVGPALAFAHVTTPTGTWIGEFEDGRGWILHDDLADRLIDPDGSDARIPPHRAEAG